MNNTKEPQTPSFSQADFEGIKNDFWQGTLEDRGDFDAYTKMEAGGDCIIDDVLSYINSLEDAVKSLLATQ